MKKFKGILVFVFALLMCATTIPTMAAESAKGKLINVEYQTYPDGTSSVEKTYVKTNDIKSAKGSGSYGTDIFTKTKEWHTGLHGNMSVICAAEISATFDWDTRTKKVKVYDVEAEVTDDCGGDISDEKTTTSGNNSKKATAKFKFKRTTSLGFTQKYALSLSCNYKGKDS